MPLTDAINVYILLCHAWALRPWVDALLESVDEFWKETLLLGFFLKYICFGSFSNTSQVTCRSSTFQEKADISMDIISKTQ